MNTSTLSALRCAVVISAVSLCTASWAQTDTSTSTATATGSQAATDTSMAGRSELRRGDRAFFEKAAKSGMKEVSVSQASLDRLTNPELKAFAQTMVSDHSRANSELMALAAKKGVVLPAKEMKWEEKWSKKTKGVDEDYIDEMVSDHEDAVELFQDASKSQDAEIAAFAQKTLPVLQHHLTTAQGLRKQLK